MANLKGYLLLGSAIALCPCHLPLFAALLAGTTLGGLLSENLTLLAAVAIVYFGGVVVLGWRLVERGKHETREACPARG